ncbi:uncharacterized protein LOC144100285 [Amblyomma americanum]
MARMHWFAALSAISFSATSICAETLSDHIKRARSSIAGAPQCLGCKCVHGKPDCEMPGSICECYNGVVYYRNSIFCPINVTHCAPEKRGPSPPPHPSCLQCGCWEENCIHENCRCDNGIMYLIDSPGVCAMNEKECQADGLETDQPKFHCLPCKCKGKDCDIGKCKCALRKLYILDFDILRCARSRSECFSM